MILRDFHKGEARSKNDLNGFDSLTNCDVHSVIGSIQPQVALTNENNTTITEPAVNAQDTSGNTYWFSTTSGKTWKRTTGASYSLVNTNAVGAHKGAAFFDGNIYYTAGAKIGLFNGSSYSDSWGTPSTDSDNPFHSVNLGLFFGAGAYIDKITSAGALSTNVLDLQTGFVVTALTSDDTGNLLIGTRISSNLNRCQILRWDTYSDSWLVEAYIEEDQVNMFINIGSQIFAQCGSAGRIYQWTGGSGTEVARMRGATTTGPEQKAIVYKGKPLIAAGQYVYSFYRRDPSLPFALVKEYTATNTIKSLATQGNTILVSHTSGVDKTGTNLATATIKTPQVPGDYKKVIVHYDSLPSGSSIGIGTQVDNAGSYTSQTPITDTINKTVYFDGGLGKTNYLQSQITLTPNGANGPVINAIEFI